MSAFKDLYKSKNKNKNSSDSSLIVLLNKAIELHREGNTIQAKKYYQDLIKKELQNYSLFMNYSLILQDTGDFLEAEIYARKALEIKNHESAAHKNIGNILMEIKNFEEAAKFFQNATKLDQNDLNGFLTLGTLLNSLDKFEDAEKATRKAIELDPNNSDSYLNLGLILINLNKFEDAEKATRKAIELDPKNIKAFLNLGTILNNLERLEEAEKVARKVIEFDASFAVGYYSLGLILKKLGKLEEAEKTFRDAISINLNYDRAHHELGLILKTFGKLEDSERSIKEAIKFNPNYELAYYNLSVVLKDLGRINEAELALRKTIELNSKNRDNYFYLFLLLEQTNNLSKLEESLIEFNNKFFINNEINLFKARLLFRNKKYSEAEKSINNISKEWIEKLDNLQKCKFYSYKAFIEDKVKSYDLAYLSYKNSKDHSNFSNCDENIYLNHIDSYLNSIKNFDQKFLNKNNSSLNYSNLSFLIGFPRSGTTLLDTILRSHKDIEVIEEKPLINNIEKVLLEKFSIKLEDIYSLSNENLNFLREKYLLEQRKYIDKEGILIIDKLPLNTVALPLINLLFPKSKIIFCHRNPYDTILSCFQQSFEANNAMKSFLSLESSAILYDKVMNAWDQYKIILPIDYINCKYEDLIDNFDGNVKRILNFLGVNWDENVKAYRETAKKRKNIKTPSSTQVIQPLYKTSINKWKKYDKYFKDCHQYLDKWNSYFDY